MKVIGCPHNIHATMAPLACVTRMVIIIVSGFLVGKTVNDFSSIAGYMVPSGAMKAK